MRAQDQPDPLTLGCLRLMRAFVRITDPAGRREVIKLADVLARTTDAGSPPIAPR